MLNCNSTVFAILVGLDFYTQDDLWLGVETGLETTTTKLVQAIKIMASCVGCALLVIRLDTWINHKSDIAPLFHLRGLFGDDVDVRRHAYLRYEGGETVGSGVGGY